MLCCCLARSRLLVTSNSDVFLDASIAFFHIKLKLWMVSSFVLYFPEINSHFTSIKIQLLRHIFSTFSYLSSLPPLLFFATFAD